MALLAPVPRVTSLDAAVTKTKIPAVGRGRQQAAYVAAKARLARGYLAGSALAMAGGAGVVASVLWLWFGEADQAADRVAIRPQSTGATEVMTW